MFVVQKIIKKILHKDNTIVSIQPETISADVNKSIKNQICITKRGRLKENESVCGTEECDNALF